MTRSVLLLSLVGLLAVTPALAAPMSGGGGGGSGLTGPDVPNGNAYRKHRAILALVQELKALEAADGGTLTPEHHAYVQAKFDSIRGGNY